METSGLFFTLSGFRSCYIWRYMAGGIPALSVYGNLILPFLTIHGICVYNWVRDILSQMILCHKKEYDCTIQKRARRLDSCLHNDF